MYYAVHYFGVPLAGDLNSPLRKEKGNQDILNLCPRTNPPTRACSRDINGGPNLSRSRTPFSHNSLALINGWDGRIVRTTSGLSSRSRSSLNCFQYVMTPMLNGPSWLDDHFSSHCAQLCSLCVKHRPFIEQIPNQL